MVASRSIGLGQLRSAQVGKSLAKSFNVLNSDLLGAMSHVADSLAPLELFPR